MSLTFSKIWQAYVKGHVSHTNVNSNVGKGGFSTLLEKVSPNNVCEGPRGNVSGHVGATNVGVNVGYMGLER